MILLAIVTILGLQVQYSFHFKPVDTDSFIIIYELTVKTWQHYLKCKCSDNEKLMKFQSFLRKNPPPQKLPSIPLLRSICRHYHWLLCRIKFELFFHYVDKKKLESQQFASIKTILSWQCRSALVLGQNIFEFIFCYIMVSSSLILIGFPFRFYHSIGEAFQFYQWNRVPLFMIDSLFIFYTFFIMIQSFTFGVYCNLMFFIFHWFEIERMQRSFIQIRIESQRTNRIILLDRIAVYRPTLRYSLLNQLKKNYREYHQLITLYRTAYTEIWGRVTFVYLVISVPLNGMCVLTLNTPDLFYDQMATVLLMLICHSLSITVMMFGIAMQTETLHIFSKYLVPIIQSIGYRNSLSIKFKYEDWFNRLLFGPKYGPNLTIAGTLTYNSIVKAIIIYIGFLIYILDHFHNVYEYDQ
nr:uncharacterized protein LOC124498529 [Dermatophagoides farinae]